MAPAADRGSFAGRANGEVERRWDSAAGTWRRIPRREGFLPPSGRQLPDVFIGMAGQPPQDVVEVGIRFHVQSFAGNHQ